MGKLTFTFPDMDYPHRIGDVDCDEGWCGNSYPKPCEETEGCSGLMHANFGDENSDGGYWLFTQCDVCGESE